MPRKGIKALTDEEILRIARISVVQSSAGVYTQTTHDTQLSIERGVIWLINFIEFYQDSSVIDDVAAGTSETEKFQITRDTKTGIQSLADADTIALYEWSVQRSAAIGTDAGPLWITGESPNRITFPVPIPYAAQNIYFGYHSTSAAAKTGVARVGYTIREVTDAFFFRVAQAILG